MILVGLVFGAQNRARENGSQYSVLKNFALFLAPYI